MLVFAEIAYAQTSTDAGFDGSGEVEFSDFLLFVGKFGARQGDGKYEAGYDLDGNRTNCHLHSIRMLKCV